MTRRRSLTDDEAQALYAEYTQWIEARRKWHPKVLRAKYGVSEKTLLRYVRMRRAA